jgi:secondary thiamine-phosphate synthase enzyme
MYDVTSEVARFVERSGLREGLCALFILHTSASLLVCENADPLVQRDLEAWLARAVPDGDPLFHHVAEGPDDMPAHVRAALTQTSLTLPVAGGRLELGTWQGIYLYEHRLAPHRRRISVTLVGE